MKPFGNSIFDDTYAIHSRLCLGSIERVNYLSFCSFRIDRSVLYICRSLTFLNSISASFTEMPKNR